MDNDKNNDQNTERASKTDFEAEFVTLTDEDGFEEQFEIVDTLNRLGEEYAALIEVSKGENGEVIEGENLLIMRVVKDADGSEELEIIEDDLEFETIGDIFMERLSDLYEFEEEEEEEYEEDDDDEDEEE